METKIILDSDVDCNFINKLNDSRTKYGDYTLIDSTEGRHIVHKCVLRLNPIFEDMFNHCKNDTNELPLDHSSDSIECLIGMLYNMTIKIRTTEEWKNILLLVDKFELTAYAAEIKSEVSNIIFDSDHGFKNDGKFLEEFLKMRHYKFIEEAIAPMIVPSICYDIKMKKTTLLEIETIETMLDTFTTKLWTDISNRDVFVNYLYNLMVIKDTDPEIVGRIFKKLIIYEQLFKNRTTH
jgi:hypothetical protein